jgi:hypothetical protein
VSSLLKCTPICTAQKRTKLDVEDKMLGKEILHRSLCLWRGRRRERLLQVALLNKEQN